MTVKGKVLVIGVVDVGGIARSAKAAEYAVYTVDFFGDLDVKRCSNRSLSILEEDKMLPKSVRTLSERLLDLAKELIHENDIDFVLLASGLDDENEMLQSLHELAPIMGNPPDVIKRIRDKSEFFEALKRTNLDFPDTHLVCNYKESLSAAKDIGFPLVVKPAAGYGGMGVVKIEHKENLEKIFKASEGELLVQEYVPGIPASISILADKSMSKILSLNEQLLGMEEFGMKEEFGYCGNIVPLDTNDDLFQECEEIANKIVAHFGLRGSNGIDIVLSNEDHRLKVIEVNPRFQGTMECIEKYLKINLIEEHIKACSKGRLPTLLPRPKSSYYGRAILSAKFTLRSPDLTSYDFVRDMPRLGYPISEGDAMCSIMADSADRRQCLRETKRLAKKIYSLGRFS